MGVKKDQTADELLDARAEQTTDEALALTERVAARIDSVLTSMNLDPVTERERIILTLLVGGILAHQEGRDSGAGAAPGWS